MPKEPRHNFQPDSPVQAANNLVILRTKVVGWPLGKQVSVKFKDFSIRGLIVSYTIIAVLLWAVTVLLVFLGGLGTEDFRLVFLCASVATFAMALGMSILTIAYICDLPAARRYRKMIDQLLDETDENTD